MKRGIDAHMTLYLALSKLCYDECFTDVKLTRKFDKTVRILQSLKDIPFHKDKVYRNQNNGRN